MFSLTDFKALLESIENESAPKQQVQPRIVQQPVIQQPVQPVVQPPIKETAPLTASNEQPKAKQTPVKTTPAQSVPPVAAKVPPVQGVPNIPKAPVSQGVPKMPTTPKKMNVPGATPAPAETPSTPEVEGEKITMLYLLQHYNKENAAAYKAQKEARKAKKGAPKPATNSGAFTVPGAPVGNVPTPAGVVPKAPTGNVPVPPQNRGFAVPGQPNASMNNIPAQTVPQQQTVQQSAPQTPIVQTPISAQPVYQAPVTPQGQAMNFGETTVLGGGGAGETTVLGASSTVMAMPYLIRSKNNEKILLNKPVFRIGKEKSYVDYFIGDNTAISRSHANIITRDGEYFVQDTNSTNHTYVNGMMIQSNIEMKLSHGDKVRLANEDFEFKLY